MLRAKMSAAKVPANLPELVRAKFNTAKANGDVNFYPTQVAVLKIGSVPVRTWGSVHHGHTTLMSIC